MFWLDGHGLIAHVAFDATITSTKVKTTIARSSRDGMGVICDELLIILAASPSSLDITGRKAHGLEVSYLGRHQKIEAFVTTVAVELSINEASEIKQKRLRTLGPLDRASKDCRG